MATPPAAAITPSGLYDATPRRDRRPSKLKGHQVPTGGAGRGGCFRAPAHGHSAVQSSRHTHEHASGKVHRDRGVEQDRVA